MRSLVYYVGASLDGYIAAPDGSPDGLPMLPDVLESIVADYPETIPTHVRGQLGLDGEPRVFDTVIMGRRTYEPALGIGVTSPYAHLDQFVVSSSLTVADDAVRVVADPVGTIERLKRGDGLDIWLAGGGQLAGAVLGLIDRIVLKTYPVLLGDGIRMVAGTYDPTAFACVDVRHFASGAIVTTYDRRQPDDPARSGSS